MNISPAATTIYKGTKMGNITPLSELLVVESPEQPVLSQSAPPDIDLTDSELSPDQQQELLALLHQYSDLFATKDQPLGHTSIVKHTIYTEGPPIRQPVRRQPVALQDAIDAEVHKMLQQGVIQQSFSPWSSPVVMVRKKDGSWRFCVDYRKLNDVTHHDAYPLPRIDSTLDSLAGSTLFTTLDLASGYWQVEVDTAHKEKTAFSTSKGHFEFNVMPFGLTNAPATFQRLMECTLAGLSGMHCLIYLDDVIVFSSNFADHLVRLSSVFDRLRAAGLKLKQEKCHFAKTCVTYLGHVISNQGIAPDKAKLESVANYPTPCTTKEVKQFIGLSNYYRRFIPSYAAIAEPLHRLLRKNTKTFKWTPECDSAFNTLKTRLITPPVLAFPRFEIPFIVATDASDYAIGGVLSQVQNGQEKVIAYWSRQLQKAERNYSTIEREALAVVSSVKEFYPYLYGFQFKLLTDHNPLTALKGLKDTGGRLARWLLYLQQFNFQFEYKSGASNSNADALSRIPPAPENLLTTVDEISLANPDTLKNAQLNDPDLAILKQHIKQGTVPRGCPPGLRKCFIKDDIICRQFKEVATQLSHTQMVVPASLTNVILREVHDNLGHLGVKKTLGYVKTRFYWPGYEQAVESWVKQCDQCQRRNPPLPNPPAPLGTITSSRPFEKLSWDIMGPLPTSSQGNKYILVITDLFTKWVEAFSLKDVTANSLATVMLNEVVCRYGVPTCIHSDQGANLRSAVIQSLCQLLGIATTRTSAYHPEGNGQVERFNRTVEAILAKLVDSDQNDWDLQLPKALFAYRTAIHESTNFTPYHLNFGRSPQLPVDLMLNRVQASQLKSYPQFVQGAHQQMKLSQSIVREQLQLQQARRKSLHDRHGVAEEFQVGDRVWLYSPAIPQGRTKKLSSLWKGPYTVVDKPGVVNYKIQLIGGTQTFVVHRNRLKLCYTPPQQESSMQTSNRRSYSDVTASETSGVAGYTSTTNSAPPDVAEATEPSTRPQRTRRPPARLDDYMRH